MGLVKAIIGSFQGALSDQWKEYFVCDSIPDDVLVRRGRKRVTAHSQNTKGDDNIITSGSVVSVAEGQCMLITEQGKIVEVCAEPGEFIYDSSTESSIFTGQLSKAIKDYFKNVGKRIAFGGIAVNDQRVYYVNTREIMGNSYSTPKPIPFKIIDSTTNLVSFVDIECSGNYSYKITNPVNFFSNVSGNVYGDFYRSSIDQQMKSELLTALQPVLNKVAEMGIEYTSLPGCALIIADKLNEVLSEKWGENRGIKIINFSISSITATKEDEDRIKELQTTAVYKDPEMARSVMIKARSFALEKAAENPNGAIMPFMMMDAMETTSSADTLYGIAQQQNWTCSCGTINSGKFCTNCGMKKRV